METDHQGIIVVPHNLQCRDQILTWNWRYWVALTTVCLLVILLNWSGVSIWITRPLVIVALFALMVPPQGMVSLVAWFSLLGIQTGQIASAFGLPGLATSLRFAPSDLTILPMALALITKGFKSASWPLRRTSLDLWLLLLTFQFCIIGNIVAYLRLGYLPTWTLLNKDVGLAVLLVAYYCIVTFLDRRDRLEMAVRTFLVSGSVINVAALVGALLYYLFRIPNPMTYEGGSLRVAGLLIDPNAYGYFAATLLVLHLAAGATRVHLLPYGRGWREANSVLLYLGTMLTLSRSTWLALVVGLSALVIFVLVAVHGRRSRDNVRTTALCAALGLITAATTAWAMQGALDPVDIPRILAKPQIIGLESVGSETPRSSTPIATPVTSSLSTPTPSLRSSTPIATPVTSSLSTPALAASMVRRNNGFEARVGIFFVGLRLWSETAFSMLVGIGVGSFLAASEALLGIPLIVHNSFLWLLIETGVVGLLALLGIIGTVTVQAWQLILKRDDHAPLAAGLLSALLVWIVWSMAVEGLYQRTFWMLLALVQVLWRAASSPIPTRKGPISAEVNRLMPTSTPNE